MNELLEKRNLDDAREMLGMQGDRQRDAKRRSATSIRGFTLE